MPELPEVETTRRGIEPYLVDRSITQLYLRERRMRWPVEDTVLALEGKKITSVRRRAKYILVDCSAGTLILHLGMSGSLRICPQDTELRKHDHFIASIGSDTKLEMRLHDPRRFGAVLWHDKADGDISEHALIKNLGPEPLSDAFTPKHLIDSCKGRKTTIKQHVMNNHVVVGAGNIYACEALFRSGIHPTRQAGKISATRLTKLTENIRAVLTEAITQGGTTLRDFVNEKGNPGYFKQQLNVYGREGEPCRSCSSIIKRIVISNRSTFYCAKCQR